MSFLHNMAKICWHLGLKICLIKSFISVWWIFFFERLNNVTRVIFKSTFLVVKVWCMSKTISKLSHSFIYVFTRLSNFLIWGCKLDLELGSVSVSTLRLRTTCGLWIFSKLQTLLGKNVCFFFFFSSIWPHLSHILGSVHVCAFFCFFFFYLQWSHYAKDEGSLFLVQLVATVTLKKMCRRGWVTLSEFKDQTVLNHVVFMR